MNKNEGREPNRNAKPKGARDDHVFKVPRVPKTKPTNKGKLTAGQKPKGKVAIKEARRLQEMKPKGVLQWAPEDLGAIYAQGFKASLSYDNYYMHQCQVDMIMVAFNPGYGQKSLFSAFYPEGHCRS